MKIKLFILSLVVILVVTCQLAPPPQAHELTKTGYKHESGQFAHVGRANDVIQSPTVYAVVRGGQECLLHPFVDSGIVSYASDGLIVGVFPVTWDGWTYISIDKEQTLKCWINRTFTEDDYWK